MALLNLKNKSNSEEKTEVPDELPSLPPIKKEAKKEEKPVELAPDELPPIKSETKVASVKAANVPQAAPVAPIPSHTLATPVIITVAGQTPSPQIASPSGAAAEVRSITNEKTDERLYFSELLKKMHNGMTQEAEKELVSSASGEIISQLNQRWENQMTAAELDRVNILISEKMKPLAQLEIQWRTLKEEMLAKNKRIKELETEIKKSSKELKGLIEQKQGYISS